MDCVVLTSHDPTSKVIYDSIVAIHTFLLMSGDYFSMSEASIAPSELIIQSISIVFLGEESNSVLVLR